MKTTKEKCELQKLLTLNTANLLSVFEVAEFEVDAHPEGVALRESFLDHARVRQDDAVDRQTGSLDRVFVHFY